MVILLMGVSGSGKTTIGKALAERLGAPFYDGDDFHQPESIAKMARGEPLGDDDRLPWLETLHDLIGDQLIKGQTAVLACSALKHSYRARLRQGNAGLLFVYLRGNYPLIQTRMKMRQGHYMPAGLVQSQFAILEEPGVDESLVVDIDGEIEETVKAVLQAISNQSIHPSLAEKAHRSTSSNSNKVVYCAVSVDGDLRLGSPKQQKAGIRAMRQVHSDLGILGSTSWLINEHDFRWTELHPEILMELAESGECIGLHDHQDTHYLETAPADRLCDFFFWSWRRIKDFYAMTGRDIPLSVHRNGCAQQSAQIYRALDRLEYTVLSDVWPGMKWHSRMIPANHPIQHWKCLAENDPEAIVTDNSTVPLHAFPWRHDADNWLDINSRTGRFLQAPITCLPWIDEERIHDMVENSREQVFLTIDTHPYDLQDVETGRVASDRVEKYHNSLEWVQTTYGATFIRIDQIPGLITIRPENNLQE